MQTRFLIAILLLAFNNSCSADLAEQECWTKLSEAHAFLYDFYEQRNLASEEAAQTRSRISDLLSVCKNSTSFLYESPGIARSVDSHISLIDLAVMANDPSATTAFISRFNELDAPQGMSENLEYGGMLVELAAAFEAPRALNALLLFSFDATSTGKGGTTPLHAASAQTPGGLEVMKLLVKAGADVDAKTDFGVSPIVAAWLQDDLPKAQCLFSLGAEIPSLEELVLYRKDALQGFAANSVERFFEAPREKLPSEIAEHCSSR